MTLNNFITKSDITHFKGVNNKQFISISNTHFRISLGAVEVMDLKNIDKICIEIFEKEGNLYLKIHDAKTIKESSIEKFKLTSHAHNRLEFRTSSIRNLLSSKLSRNDQGMIYFYCINSEKDPFTYIYSEKKPKQYFLDTYYKKIE